MTIGVKAEMSAEFLNFLVQLCDHISTTVDFQFSQDSFSLKCPSPSLSLSFNLPKKHLKLYQCPAFLSINVELKDISDGRLVLDERDTVVFKKQAKSSTLCFEISNPAHEITFTLPCKPGSDVGTNMAEEWIASFEMTADKLKQMCGYFSGMKHESMMVIIEEDKVLFNSDVSISVPKKAANMRKKCDEIVYMCWDLMKLTPIVSSVAAWCDKEKGGAWNNEVKIYAYEVKGGVEVDGYVNARAVIVYKMDELKGGKLELETELVPYKWVMKRKAAEEEKGKAAEEEGKGKAAEEKRNRKRKVASY